ncbi:solute carrier family 35 member F3-like isoform X2 [Branchiostoma lanceolatum]|uniref:solute carrier family 35 member F3-like isoform X2 n=1 Tax=Branchiostoma lanceolatum TaxID=7740 RepID=UPI0034551368
MPLSPTSRKALLGTPIVLGIAVSWVGSTQFAQSTFSASFDGPFFNMWFSTVWMMACFPVYTAVCVLLKGQSCGQVYRENESIFGADGLTLRTLLVKAGFFLLLWAGTNYLNIRALKEIPATDVTALFSSCNAFVYVFSILLLRERLYIGRVLFKRVFGDASVGQVSLFLSCLGILDLLGLWPVMLSLYYGQVETMDWYHLPWSYLCGGAALGLAFNFFINFGIAFTFPLFISLGTVLGIPLNAGVDAVFRGVTFGPLKAGGAALVVGGFLLMLAPEEAHRKVCDVMCCVEPTQETDETERLLSGTPSVDTSVQNMD